MLTQTQQLKINQSLRKTNNLDELNNQKQIIKIYKTYSNKIKDILSLFNGDIFLEYMLYLSLTTEINNMYREISSVVLKSVENSIIRNYVNVMSILQTGLYTSPDVQSLMVNRNTGLSVSEELQMNRSKLLTDIRANLTPFIETGYTPATISDIIYNRKGGILRGDVAKTIKLHRTELTRVRALSKLEAENHIKAAGYKTYRTWVYTWESVKPRPSHVASHGLRENKNGYFEIDGYLTRGPGLFGVPSEDINCRCDTNLMVEMPDEDMAINYSLFDEQIQNLV